MTMDDRSVQDVSDLYDAAQAGLLFLSGLVGPVLGTADCGMVARSNDGRGQVGYCQGTD